MRQRLSKSKRGLILELNSSKLGVKVNSDSFHWSLVDRMKRLKNINAQELMFLARKRLCMQAAEETRQVVKEIVRQVEELCPEFKGLFGPLCQYRNGACDEFYCCGLNKKFEKK